MKKYCMLLILLWLCHSSMAQAIVKGTISDQDSNAPLVGAHILIQDTQQGTVSEEDGSFNIELFAGESGIVISHPNYESLYLNIQRDTSLNIKLKPLKIGFDTIATFDPVAYEEKISVVPTGIPLRKSNQKKAESFIHDLNPDFIYNEPHEQESLVRDPTSLNTEEYRMEQEQRPQNPWDTPFSTFSIDVDHASYSNVRRFLNNNEMPPKGSIRVEEMINYFDYTYPRPTGQVPFETTTEVSDCPWNKDRHLLHIGIQGEEIPFEETPANNLVFLLDVSGSMNGTNKLPLVKQAFRLLVEQLRPEDQVSIVVYAGAAGLILPPTSGAAKETILGALDRLKAGGSTAGGQGITLAYETAQVNFLKDGNNRVIIATDGDFNVGPSSESDLEALISEKAGQGIFLSVLGFGMGNLKDNKLELLSNRGDGNYAYIDNLLEARKVFVKSLTGTLYTIAKDVKIQVEFNPALVKSYRLVGYENRQLDKLDFDDDKKDAGELGAGHSVTALYELELYTKPIKKAPGKASVYQRQIVSKKASTGKELGMLYLRYKKPKDEESQLLSRSIANTRETLAESSQAFRFAASVAGFGLLLKGSSYADWSYQEIQQLAKTAMGKDQFGYRQGFLTLVRQLEQ
ncbi:MAG: von Willebrand factor type A domain-containing protein [Saprospiraceae bacterium]|nr:von Willebrand factor type A domain-containing protein [Saprospiraceae bacterium]